VIQNGWQAMRIKLTDRFVKSATSGGRKSPIFMDDEVIGFGIQVCETGRKSFTLDYMFEARRRPLSMVRATVSPPICFAAIRAFAQQHPENVSFQFFSLRHELSI
jgi:hypothetical protein